MITPFLYKKQSKLTKILADVSYITFSEPKDGLLTSGSGEGKSVLLLDSWLHDYLTGNIDRKVPYETLWNPKENSTKLIREGSDQRSDPLSFYMPFLIYTFYWQIVPSFTYLLKKFASSYNFFKRTNFKI